MTINPTLLQRWILCAQIVGVPYDSLQPEVKIVKDPKKRTNFSFGIILNKNRESRPSARDHGQSEECVLCDLVKKVQDDDRRNLDLENKLPK